MKTPHKIGCLCDGDGDQLSLIHMPALVKPKRKATPGVRYARYKPKVRSLCDDCVADIHRLGVAVAPLPQPVRWRRSTPEGSTHLCEQHKDLRVEAESRD